MPTTRPKTFGIDFRSIGDKTISNALLILTREISKLQEEIIDLKSRLPKEE